MEFLEIALKGCVQKGLSRVAVGKKNVTEFPLFPIFQGQIPFF
jgi:hypothetical protein